MRSRVIALILAFGTTAAPAHAADKLCDMCCVSETDSGCIVVSPELAASRDFDLDLSRTGETAMNRRSQATVAAGVLALVALVSQARQQPPGKPAILGDSIAEGEANVLGQRVLDFGIGGATSKVILEVEVPKIPKNTPVVFIECCINDGLLGVPLAETVANVQAIIAGVPAGAQVRLIGTLPTNEAKLAQFHPTFLPADSNAAVAKVNAAIASVCKGPCSIVPPPFPTPLPAPATFDGIHLTGSVGAPAGPGASTFAKALH